MNMTNKDSRYDTITIPIYYILFTTWQQYNENGGTNGVDFNDFFFLLYSENFCISTKLSYQNIFFFHPKQRTVVRTTKYIIIPCLLGNNFFQSSLFARETLTTLYQCWSKENFKLVFETRVADPDQFFKTDFVSVFKLNIPV